MEDIVRQLLILLRGMWLHRWLGLIVAWVVGLVAAVVVFALPDKFQATARIYVDTDSVLRPLMSGLVVQSNTEQQIAVLSRTLISRPNVEKLVRMADLDLGLKTSAEKEELISHVTKTLKIRSVGKENLYTLEYSDPNPDSAARVVQSMTTIFVESGLGGKRVDTDSARKFIDDQIAVYQKKLEEAEARVKEFRLRNYELDLDKAGGASVKVAELNNQLGQARLELREAENARQALRQQLAGAEGAASSAASIAVPEIDSRIDAVQRRLDGLLQQYTEAHPDVVNTRRVLDDLERQKRQEIAARKKLAASNPSALLGNDSVSPSLKASLATAEAQSASLRARVAEFESRYNAAVARMKQLPLVETEFAQLNRDYDVIKKQYEGLVERRESAAISEGMASVAGVADFRLIDPPRVSPQPVEPNRLILLPLALLASLAVGAVASFGASQIKPAFIETKVLREVSGLPLLGVISRIRTPEYIQSRRREVIRAASVVIALVAAYSAAMVGAFVLLSRTG